MRTWRAEPWYRGTVVSWNLHQHGPNANGPDADGGHSLVCGGLELYGTLLDGAAYE